MHCIWLLYHFRIFYSGVILSHSSWTPTFWRYQQVLVQLHILCVLDCLLLEPFKLLLSDQIRSDQSLSRVWLFATPWITARQASLSFIISWSLFRLTSIELVMPSNRLILCHPLPLLLSLFPTSGSFPVSQLFASGGQSVGASAPTNFEWSLFKSFWAVNIWLSLCLGWAS